jgi:hypothetical protein
MPRTGADAQLRSLRALRIVPAVESLGSVLDDVLLDGVLLVELSVLGVVDGELGNAVVLLLVDGVVDDVVPLPVCCAVFGSTPGVVAVCDGGLVVCGPPVLPVLL